MPRQDPQTQCARCRHHRHVERCHDCGLYVCTQCTVILNGRQTCRIHEYPCDICGETYTAEDLDVCEQPGCDLLLCETCGYTWGCYRYCERHHEECVHCHRNNDPDGGWCNTCQEPVCDACSYWCDQCDERVCAQCSRWCEPCGHDYCEYCYEHNHEDCDHDEPEHQPEYANPYTNNPKAHEPFTFGLEIEIDGQHDHDELTESPLVAGWCTDQSLAHGGLEYQTQPLTSRPDTIHQLENLIHDITTPAGNAGGHMHVSRTPRQTPARWYWALKGLTPAQARSLNMRHTENSRWCQLRHGDYHGKNTAVNADHANTIELRTFGAWNTDNADKLTPAVQWAHGMWRFLQHHPVGQLKTRDIMATSRTICHAVQPARPRTIENRRLETSLRKAKLQATETAKSIIDDATAMREAERSVACA